LELDLNKIPTRIRVARSAIKARLSQIGHSVDDKPEQQALEDALSVLILLEKPPERGTAS
jgi:hypothetical protein